MRADVENSLSQSARDFLAVVAPAIKCYIGDGRILSNEEIGSLDLRQAMDILAGVDAWQIQDRRGRMRSIASRVQVSDKNWQSFTVRTRRASGNATELAKRLEAFRQPGGWLFPALTVQAYLRAPGGPLLGAGVIRTADLFAFIETHPAGVREKPNHEDCGPGCRGHASRGARCAWWAPYWWLELQRAGIDVGTVPPGRWRHPGAQHDQ